MEVVHLVGNGFDISAGLGTDARTLISEFCRVIDRTESSIPHPAIGLAQVIRDEGIGQWCDFEAKLGEYSNNENVADNPREFAEAKSYFDKTLHALLQARVPLISESFIEANGYSCLKSLGSICSAMSPGDQNKRLKIQSGFSNPNSFKHYVISFNYLPTLSLMFRNRSGVFQRDNEIHEFAYVAYAHGDLDGIPVCGVDNVGQLANKDFRNNPEVVNTLVKSEIQGTCGSLEGERALSLIANADIICIHGMSCGKTDGRWWNAIASRLKQNSQTLLILSAYGFSDDYHVPLERWRDQQNESDRFFRGSSLKSDEIETLRKRVFVIPSKKLFTISEKAEFETLSDDDIQTIARKLCSKE